VTALRRARGADLVAVCGLAVAVSGLAVVGGALVAAAQAGPGSSAAGWESRLVAGLWRVRLEHAVWFTAGAVAFLSGLERGATLGRLRGPAVRAVAGMAVGMTAVAAAVALAATDVALAGRVGSGVGALHPSGRERIGTWLLQVVTAAAAGLVWTVVAARLVAPTQPAGAAEALDDAAPPLPQPAVRPSPSSAGQRAERLYRERLAFSPRRAVARELVERISALERDGLAADAAVLLDRLQQMDADPG